MPENPQPGPQESKWSAPRGFEDLTPDELSDPEIAGRYKALSHLDRQRQELEVSIAFLAAGLRNALVERKTYTIREVGGQSPLEPQGEENYDRKEDHQE